jgi:hypothetical protein
MLCSYKIYSFYLLNKMDNTHYISTELLSWNTKEIVTS